MVSVIIPVYQVEKYLDRCVKSVCEQSYSNLEIILVDDGSPDACPEMCENWAKKDNRIKVLHQENGGLSAARNSGLRISHGEYIIYVDSDDYIKKDMIEALVDAIQKNDADIAMSTFYLSSGEKESSRRLSGEVLAGNTEDMIPQVYSNGLWQAWAKLIKREIALKCPFVDRLIYEDYENTPRLLSLTKRIVILMDGRYIYTVRDNGIMGERKNSTSTDFARITNKNLELYEKIDYQKNVKEYLYSFLFKQLAYNFHITIKNGSYYNDEFLTLTRKVFAKHRSKWMRNKAIELGRKISYIFLMLLPNIYCKVYLLSHRRKSNEK